MCCSAALYAVTSFHHHIHPLQLLFNRLLLPSLLSSPVMSDITGDGFLDMVVGTSPCSSFFMWTPISPHPSLHFSFLHLPYLTFHLLHFASPLLLYYPSFPLTSPRFPSLVYLAHCSGPCHALLHLLDATLLIPSCALSSPLAQT